MFGPRAPARLGARSGLLALLRVMVCVPSASSPSQGLVNCVPPSSVPRTGYRYWHVPMWHGYNTVWFRMIFNLTKRTTARGRDVGTSTSLYTLQLYVFCIHTVPGIDSTQKRIVQRNLNRGSRYVVAGLPTGSRLWRSS